MDSSTSAAQAARTESDPYAHPTPRIFARAFGPGVRYRLFRLFNRKEHPMTYTTQTLVTLGILGLILTAPTPSPAMEAIPGPSVVLNDEYAIGMSLRGSAGYLDGTAHEYVYEYLPTGEKRKLSELIWDLKDVWMIGGVMSLDCAEWMRLNAGFWMGVTQGDGEMLDYDWLYQDIDEWTDYSRSLVDVESANIFDINATFRICEWQGLSPHVVLGYKQDSWEWSDSGQEYIYTIETFRDTTGDFGGENMIDYEQWFSIPYFGATLRGEWGPVVLEGYYLYSPIGQAEDKDHHIARQLIFEEDFEDVEYTAYGISGTFSFTDRFFAMVSYSYQEMPETTGDMTVVDEITGLTYAEDDIAGISHEASLISGSLGWTF
jgi:outer membrane protease